MFESWPEMWGGGYPAYRTTLRKFLWFRTVTGGNAPEFKTITGRIVSFLTQRIAPLKIEADLVPIQSGTGDPSPDNVRPISGHSGADIYDDPKYGGTIEWNQLWATDVSAYVKYFSTLTFANDVFTLTISATNNARKTAGVKNAITVGHKYYVSAYGENHTTVYANILQGVIGADDISDRETVLSWSSEVTSFTKKHNIFTANTADIAFIINASDRTVGDYVLFKNVMLCDLTAMFGEGNEPETVDEFEALFPKDYYAYNSGTKTCVSAVNGDPYTKVTLTFGQTVYGGTLTVNEDGTGTGKARPYYASYNGETLVGPWVSSMDAYAPGATPTTGAQVVDMGGTETTISLSPGQVNALLGNNTVWVDDSDNISVTYQSN